MTTELAPEDVEAASRAWHSVYRIAGSVILMTIAYYLIPFSGGDTRTVVIRSIMGCIALATFVILRTRSVMVADHTDMRSIERLATLVPIILFMFASGYLLISDADLDSFSEPLSHTGALYFSEVTMTTVGFGDISPKSNLARIVVMSHMIVNVFVIGFVGRLLVHKVRSNRQARSQATPTP